MIDIDMQLRQNEQEEKIREMLSDTHTVVGKVMFPSGWLSQMIIEFPEGNMGVDVMNRLDEVTSDNEAQWQVMEIEEHNESVFVEFGR